MNVVELEAEIERLKDRNAFLMRQVTGKINCAYFCALPECAMELINRRSDDQNITDSQAAC